MERSLLSNLKQYSKKLQLSDARLLPKKTFKKPTRPKAKELHVGAQPLKILGAAAKNLSAQGNFLGEPGCWAPVKQQPEVPLVQNPK